jgi:UDP-glucose 4-epimerase
LAHKDQLQAIPPLKRTPPHMDLSDVLGSDVVDAITAAAAADAHGAFNVGRGVETSVLDLVGALHTLGDELGIDHKGFEPEFAPARPGEVQRSAIEPAKSRNELGFEAAVNLEDGLRRTLETLL